jgi:putative aminopeptidase FrvX
MNIKLLKSVLAVQSESYNSFRMFAFIVRFLKNNDIPFYVDNGNIYVTKGHGESGFPCIVSHTDTVHEIQSNLTVSDVGGNLVAFNTDTMEQIGIGGDDKVGIFVCLSVLSKFDNVKACFFRDEETGCNGSFLADKPFFEDVNFVLQCDRKGNTDFVTNAAGSELSSKKFKKDVSGIIKNYGYSFCNFGGLTDVVALKNIGIDVSMANISCGYYDPHCATEWVSIADVLNVLGLCSDIFKQIGGIPYPHKEVVKDVKKSYYNNHKSNYKWDTNTFADDELLQDSNNDYIPCDGCITCNNTVKLHKHWGIYLCESCTKVYD